MRPVRAANAVKDSNAPANAGFSLAGRAPEGARGARNRHVRTWLVDSEPRLMYPFCTGRSRIALRPVESPPPPVSPADFTSRASEMGGSSIRDVGGGNVRKVRVIEGRFPRSRVLSCQLSFRPELPTIDHLLGHWRRRSRVYVGEALDGSSSSCWPAALVARPVGRAVPGSCRGPRCGNLASGAVCGERRVGC